MCVCVLEQGETDKDGRRFERLGEGADYDSAVQGKRLYEQQSRFCQIGRKRSHRKEREKASRIGVESESEHPDT